MTRRLLSFVMRPALSFFRMRSALSFVMPGLDPGIHLLAKNDGSPDQARR
jgi:hypothetical protein